MSTIAVQHITHLAMRVIASSGICLTHTLSLSHTNSKSVLSKEGKIVNPDNATGAALEAALKEVAERRSSHSRLKPDKWELKRTAWEGYDPDFFHISLRNHQNAAENRPKTSVRGSSVTTGTGGSD